jgi:hypothetical protein
MAQLIEDEARAIAGKVIINSFKRFIADLDSTNAVNTDPDVDELAFSFGIEKLSEDDLKLIDDMVNSAKGELDIYWQELESESA